MSKFLAVVALASFAFVGVAYAADQAGPAEKKDGGSLSSGAKSAMPATQNSTSPSSSDSSGMSDSSSMGAGDGTSGTGNGQADPAGKKDSGSLSSGANSAMPGASKQ